MRVWAGAAGNAAAVCALIALCYVFVRGLFAPTFTWGFMGWWDASVDLGITAIGLAWVGYHLVRRIQSAWQR